MRPWKDEILADVDKAISWLDQRLQRRPDDEAFQRRGDALRYLREELAELDVSDRRFAEIHRLESKLIAAAARPEEALEPFYRLSFHNRGVDKFLTDLREILVQKILQE